MHAMSDRNHHWANIHRSHSRTKARAQSHSGRLQRLLATIQLLQSDRAVNASDLSEKFGVSHRTVYRDIRCLQDAGLKIVVDHGHGGYRLPHRISLPQSEISQLEALSLLLLCQDRSGGGRAALIRAAATAAAEKVCHRLSPQTCERLKEFTNLEIFDACDGPMSPTMSQVYECVWRSFVEKRSLCIETVSEADGNAIRTLFDPFRIFFTRYGWYIIGRCHEHRDIRILDPSLIRQVEIVENSFTVPPQFSVKRLIANAAQMLGFSRDRTEVVVRFDPCMAQHVAASQWNNSQQMRFLEDGALEFRAVVASIDEISKWVLGFGEFAEVLQPPALRDRIRCHAANMVQMYSPRARAVTETCSPGDARNGTS